MRDHTRTNRFRFWKQANRTAVQAEDLAAHLPHPGTSSEAALIARQQLAQVWETVGTLSERQRTVFLLRFVDELELAEIAEITGLPISTVKTHLYRSLATIRSRHHAAAQPGRSPDEPLSTFRLSSQHLSDEQMYALLDDSLPSEASPRLHLLSCASCQAELAMLGASLTDLRVATTHLAAARVSGPRPSPGTAAKDFLLRNAWAASLATASVALAVSLTLVHPHRVPAPAAPGNVAAATGPGSAGLR